MLNGSPGTWHSLGRVFSDETLRDKGWARGLSEASWRALAETALQQMVAPELYYRLIEIGLEEIPPRTVMEALEGAAELNGMAHDGLRAMFRDICRICNAAGLRPIVLKGAIDSISPRDSINASRMVSDLDIMLDSAFVPDVFQRLLDAGFTRDILDFSPDLSMHLDSHHHYPPLWHPSVGQYVELHGRLGSSLSHRWLTTSMRNALAPREIDGMEFMVPDTYARLQHNAAHHYINDILRARMMPSFRQLLDFFRLAKRWQAEMSDPVPIDERCEDEGTASGLRVSAAMSNQLFFTDIPHGALRPVESRFISVFRQRFESPVFNMVYTHANKMWRQARRLRNWRNLFSQRFYRLRFIKLTMLFRGLRG